MRLYFLLSLMTSPSFTASIPRLNGAISEHLCTPALPSRTEPRQTKDGWLSLLMCCLPLCQGCWPSAAAPTQLISWNLLPRDRATTTRRKTRTTHLATEYRRNTLCFEKANAFRGVNKLKNNLLPPILNPKGDPETLLSGSFFKSATSHGTPCVDCWTLIRSAADGGEGLWSDRSAFSWLKQITQSQNLDYKPRSHSLHTHICVTKPKLHRFIYFNFFLLG